MASPRVLPGLAGASTTRIDRAVPIGLKSVGYRVAARLNTGAVSPWSVTASVPFGSQKPAAARGVDLDARAEGGEGSAEGVGPIKEEERKDAG